MTMAWFLLGLGLGAAIMFVAVVLAVNHYWDK